MSKEKRTILSVIKGIWIRFLTVIIPFTFPAKLTTSLHRLKGIKIGKGTKINRTAQMDDSYPKLIKIGKKVWVTGGVIILCHQRDLAFYEKGKAVMDCPLKTGKVIIKDGAHIGIGSRLMPGVTIGKGAVIGAGAVVTKDIPDYSVAVGTPARVIKTF